MYHHIRGRVVDLSPTQAVIETGGVGYRIHIPLSTFHAVKGREEALLLVTLYVREDRIRLFGFASPDERSVFERILGVSGFGPGIALSILSSLTVDEFARAVNREDARALTRVKGLGKKLAERMILELQGKLPQPSEAGEDRGDERWEQTVLALVSLGFTRKVAAEAADRARAADPNGSTEEWVRLGLREGK
ncbi:MAG: Holliday junction branch migration protein RuvA [Planctomycetes bacterium]|nr:Holliday junction branch migration protein RuvA [Planctomycetota bacterium]